MLGSNSPYNVINTYQGFSFAGFKSVIAVSSSEILAFTLPIVALRAIHPIHFPNSQTPADPLYPRA
jgi:hypothetical protein